MNTDSGPGLRSLQSTVARWWRQPDQFEWLTGYLRARELGLATRVLMTLMSGAVILLPASLLTLPHFTPAAVLVSILATLTGTTYAVLWWRSWPTRIQSLSMAVVTGGLVAVVTLLQPEPVFALMGCTALALVGGYMAFFHNIKAVTYTVALAVVAGAACASRLIDDHTAIAVVGFCLVLELNVAFPLSIQAVVRTLGADVVRSDHDPLTGLLNRRAFYERATTLLTAPFDDVHLLVVMIDLDKFKTLNDTYGHIAGDQALASVGWTLRQASTAAAIIGRFGGEEFIVIDALPHDAACALPQRLCEAIADLPHPVTASVGAAVVRWSGVADPPAAIEALIRAADTAMYTAKKNGGNQTHFCTPAPSF